MAETLPQRRSRGWVLATAAFVVAAVLIWVPRSWDTHPRDPRGEVTLIEVGLLHPLKFAWESWAEGVQFQVVEVRPLPLAGSAALTLAAGMLGAPWCYRRSKRDAEPGAAPDRRGV
jgi:4-amino-4-deoxy-L-arabinose transferase-like glycosyltransferase